MGVARSPLWPLCDEFDLRRSGAVRCRTLLLQRSGASGAQKCWQPVMKMRLVLGGQLEVNASNRTHGPRWPPPSASPRTHSHIPLWSSSVPRGQGDVCHHRLVTPSPDEMRRPAPEPSEAAHRDSRRCARNKAHSSAVTRAFCSRTSGPSSDPLSNFDGITHCMTTLNTRRDRRGRQSPGQLRLTSLQSSPPPKIENKYFTLKIKIFNPTRWKRFSSLP